MLDEFTYPMTWGWVDVDEVVEVADLVLETTKVKHPMDAGRLGQRGIEW